MLKVIVALVWGLILAAQAHAEGDVQPLNGIWTGTIGKLPVNVCLQVKDGEYNFGAYYYLSHLKLINLQTSDKGGWTEGTDEAKPDAVWTLKMAGGDTVSGSWVGNGKTFDVNLHRLAKLSGEDVDSPCGANEFFKPRLTPPKITETPATLDGQPYTKVKVEAGKQFDAILETFKLPGKGAGIAAINKQLLEGVPQNGSAPGYVECLQQATTMGRDGDYDVSLSPTVLTAHWLVVGSGDGSFCGGAHPANSSSEQVYDLRNGKALDLRTWFASGIAAKDGKLSGKLESMVMKAFTDDKDNGEECAEAVKDNFGWDVSLASTGMSFTPELPYVSTACANAVVIGFKEAAEFLKPEGQKQLAEFHSELK
ncbi:hypothetical protein [Aestuariivirga litoralis]|uniref:hypothetical protein n=1 Tax=Aestuariivirga litoralis TaxID=2650924 RepID=UPI0018C85661|nr:hypothetical protein [Aestuariivirga litoralis]MBG1230864.1 hypothetical protein [Aestuariivirga litoralis]